MESMTPISNILSYRSHIMLFSALWILCSHSVSTVGEEQWNFLLKFKPIIAFGWGGVDIFLFLSGLGIGLSLTKKQTTKKVKLLKTNGLNLPVSVPCLPPEQQGL